MSFSKNINKRKYVLNITAILTVISLFVYVFAFSLPHDLHCSQNDTAFTKLLINTFEKTHHEDVSNDSDRNEDSNQKHNQNDCPICNLSYFNSLNLSKPLIFDFALEVTNEKPVYKIQTGFSSFSYLKFFLRSPPYFAA